MESPTPDVELIPPLVIERGTWTKELEPESYCAIPHVYPLPPEYVDPNWCHKQDLEAIPHEAPDVD